MPMSLNDSIKMLFPAILIGTIVSAILRDYFPLLLALGLGYFCIVIIGRHFTPYQIELGDASKLKQVTELLNRTPYLSKITDSLIWTRPRIPSFLKSKSDDICIAKIKDGWVIEGRKYDILSLSAALTHQ